MGCDHTRARINLKPSVWGKSAWAFLYSVAISFPNDPTHEDGAAAAEMMRSLQYLLPCASCRASFATEVREDPPEHHRGCSGDFVKYVNALQNRVSRRTGGKQRTVSESISSMYAVPSTPMPTLPISNINADESDANTRTVVAYRAICPKEYWHLIWIVLLVALLSGVCTWAITRSTCMDNRAKRRTLSR